MVMIIGQSPIWLGEFKTLVLAVESSIISDLTQLYELPMDEFKFYGYGDMLTRPQRDLRISRDPGIELKSRSRDFLGFIISNKTMISKTFIGV